MRVDKREAVLIIDTFRAATTACHVLAGGPRDYFLVADSAAAARLASTFPYPLLIGKPEIGATLAYHLPNSPSRVAALDLAGRTVIHRTTAGAGGVLAADAAADVLLAGFVNVGSTARMVLGRPVRVLPMGHEGVTPTLEDDLTAACIEARMRGEPFDLAPHLDGLREGPGRYFFEEDQAQYPGADFDLCLAIDSFDFAIRSERFGDYARLSRA
jgi:2-phosphosulfolactate phosphatase